ncbi:MAG: methyltransferase domain-containing protein, partial [Planctomycetes bacterium]|nr:methyltransferase domain-containing protein [Planctomycetota bacterium]
YGIFADEYRQLTGATVTVIEPGPALAAVCRDKGLEVIQSFLEKIKPGVFAPEPKVFVSFELFEHLHHPRFFLRQLLRLMEVGDLFIFTTLSGVGVDIQALWEYSRSVSPPHHLNFFNPKSVQLLLEDMGFEVMHSATPGRLDIDILCNNQDQIKDRFWRTFALQATMDKKQQMKSFIAAHGLSSHMLVVARKNKDVKP